MTKLPRRFFDFSMRAIALFLLLVVLPLLLSIAAAIIACGRSPLFCQARIGLNNRSFTIMKLRTVDCVQSRRLRSPWQDSAFARLALWLRQNRLDELPQLANIILGHMVFVGPRPLIAVELVAMGPGHTLRQAVKPGLTGLAQLSGGNRLSPAAKLRVDLHYIERRSILFDARILLSTLPRVVQGIDVRYQQHDESVSGAVGLTASSPMETRAIDR
jgi:lipopolysaccharide/colanic/teichoic acid biosynthesis glycosyltransferase